MSLKIAHRGYSAKYPENSLLAFTKSLKKFDMVEFDIQFTKDGIPIVFHDYKIKRLTNNLHKEKKICNLTLTEIKELKLKHHTFKNEEILTLNEFLLFAKKNKLKFNLEIKDMKNMFEDTYSKITQILILLKAYNIKYKNFIISSFNHSYLRFISNVDDKYNLGCLVEEKNPKNLISYLEDLNIYSYHIDKSLVNKTLIKKLHNNGIKVGVYTINDKKLIKKYINLGIDMIFSDIKS